LPAVAWALQARDSKGVKSDAKEGHLIPICNGGGFGEVTAFTAGNLARGEGPRPSADVFPTFQKEAGDQHPCVATQYAVRRLTPKECARLQGFPDDYLDITYRGKPAADGPKYKAIGNSMAVPCMAWIGQRIAAVEKLTEPT
jgi:site-specific DNA-cytosine methylase